jgi:hypothetical protein
MSHFSSLIKATVMTSCLLLPLSISATEFEVTPFFGQMYGSDLIAIDNETAISVDSATNYGIAIAWQESPNGQGQILLNIVSHDFDAESVNDSLDIIYAHFNGVAQFRQQSYVTTVSLGLGGAYFDAQGGQELYPSATLAFGTRYEFSPNLSLVTEVRGYASLVDENDNLFCRSEICTAQFDDTLWIDTTVSIGFAYKF